MTLTIKTNNQPRETFYIFQLDEKDQKVIKKQFDYYTEEEIQEQSFFNYKGYWYSLNDFLRIRNSEELKGWDGYISDSYFSGVLVKVVEDFMSDYSVIVGRYYS
jgi:hypothetical protein